MLQYAALAAAAKVCFDHFEAYGESRWLYAAALALLATAAAYESRAAGCTLDRCTQADNRAAGLPATGREAMCAESRRVTWRVAYAIAFAVFTVLNVVRLHPRENLAMLLATWAIANGTLTFLAYHRYGAWCA
jgi:hypothetical protein